VKVSLSPPGVQAPLQGNPTPFAQAWRDFFQNVGLTLKNLLTGPSFGSPVYIDGADATERLVIFTTAGVARWAIGTDASAEGGGAGGSDLTIYRYDATGVTQTAIAQVNRSTGALHFSMPTTPAVTGSRGGNAALASLLTALGASKLGLIVDSSTP
jgi:hypothetical protein